ncbi:MAG: methyl-accepting chemotaxis protein [Treponema sp.]|jgi:methyl-accepting chemotaxis protein|nr:methyl-accepting chemotaxis protein [Treponema sp.]
MSNSAPSDTDKKKNRTSIRRSVLIFSIILFAIIFIAGSIVFTLSMWRIARENMGSELARDVEAERIQLEASVNGEIAIAMKMADSPIIQRYFANPTNAELERTAFEEIAGYRRAFAGNSVFWVNDVDKGFYSDDAYSHTLDINDPNNYWYLMTLNQSEKYNFNINYNPDLDVTNLWINAPVHDSRRRPIGILGTGINLSAFIDSIYKNYSGKATLYFFNMEGEITGAKDIKLVTEKVKLDKVPSLGYTGGEDGEKTTGELIFEKSKEIKNGQSVFFSTPIGEVAICEIPSLNWYIAAVHHVGILDAIISTMTLLFLAMMAVIAIIFIIFYIYISLMIKPMNDMVETLDHISVDWDLTQRLKFSRRDEIGTLGQFFNLTFERIGELIRAIKGKTISLSDTGDELSAHTETTKRDVENINSNVQGMMKQILSQSDKVNTAANSMEHIISGLDKLNEHITVQANNVAQSSAAIEQMIANIQSVTHTLVKNTANITSLSESSEAGRADLQKVSADIQEIARESEGLLQINSVMQTIASQTNLLAMNAAIEAAHAGETGKGFAVVADEIRKLAVNSSSQSKTIISVLKKIKTMIDLITKSTGVVIEQFEIIQQEVQTVSNQETQIRNAMEEQGEGSRQILEAITQLNSVSNLVRKASSDMTSESKEVMTQSSELKRITGEVAGNMDEMTHNAEEIANAFVRVEEITHENRENIVALSEDIARFRVEA